MRIPFADIPSSALLHRVCVAGVHENPHLSAGSCLAVGVGVEVPGIAAVVAFVEYDPERIYVGIREGFFACEGLGSRVSEVHVLPPVIRHVPGVDMPDVVVVDKMGTQVAVLVAAEHYVFRADVAVYEVPSLRSPHAQQGAYDVKAQAYGFGRFHRSACEQPVRQQPVFEIVRDHEREHPAIVRMEFAP